jgi:hypothetical protein
MRFFKNKINDSIPSDQPLLLPTYEELLLLALTEDLDLIMTSNAGEGGLSKRKGGGAFLVVDRKRISLKITQLPREKVKA